MSKQSKWCKYRRGLNDLKESKLVSRGLKGLMVCKVKRVYWGLRGVRVIKVINVRNGLKGPQGVKWT